MDLTGWTISDENIGQQDNTFFLYPGGGWEIGAQGYLVLEKGIDHAFGLGSKDEVWLYNAEGAIADILSWDKDKAKPSWCRVPDGGTAQTCTPATFGSAN